ncbi:polysaccharide biosynthesis tyrosine autokinase [Paractinoplanes durhamensis]|uniref:Chromosome partitioning protein n=1 Tax=Paractinoplanes durhamensis TaxID=113563 RepID=A0ABQ3YR47_9ACTN|nr:polysaccharide biosynthesis tyrosine autokinase [Actinoplanes durhamensis]GIE00061.1 chromosome partitioning protein [Actinoplanes durhamensis]
MEIRDYLRVVQRQWWVVAIMVFVALGVTQVINKKTTPEYAASAVFFLSSARDGESSVLEGSMFVAARLKTYTELLTGEQMLKEIAASTNTGLSLDDIEERITVTVDSGSVLLTVTVTDTMPSRAEKIADVLVKRFPPLVQVLEKRTAAAGPAVVVEIVQPVLLDPDPVSPRPLHNDALAVAVGLLVGAAAGVIREVCDSSLRVAGVLPGLTGLPVLALIPIDRRVRRKLRAKDSGPFVSDSRSARAEALRQLRTNVQFADRDHPVKILAVTSAMPGEGRSSTACGLAILFAEAGQRVLIVDAELRRPRLAAFLGREGSAGLTTVLVGAASLDQVLQPWGSGLWLLASGHRPPNPSELLGSARMEELIAELRDRFDKIIFDSPPLLPVTDGAVVAARADGALLLVRARKTTAAQVTAAVRALAAVDARLLGPVFNMVAAPRRRIGLPTSADTTGPPLPPAPRPGGWNAIALSGAL